MSLQKVIQDKVKEIENNELFSLSEKIEKKLALLDIISRNKVVVPIGNGSSLLTKDSVDNVFKESHRYLDAILLVANSYKNEMSKFNAIACSEGIIDASVIEEEEDISYSIVRQSKVRKTDSLTLTSSDFNKKARTPSDILISTNGILGDTRRVDSSNDYIGEHLKRDYIGGILSDELLCIEKYGADKSELKRCFDKGLTYKEGISYISDTTSLSSHITFEYDNIKANYLRFRDIGPIAFSIRELYVEEENGNIVQIVKNRDASGDNIFFFKEMVIRRVTLFLEQEDVEVVTSIRNATGGDIGALCFSGMSIDKGELKITPYSRATVIKDKVDKSFERGYIYSKRLSQTLGEFEVKQIDFETEGSIVMLIESIDPIAKITLSSIEDIYDGQDIKYSISLDDNSYHSIAPAHRLSPDLYSSVLFSHKGIETKSNVKQLLTSFKVKRLYLKIELSSKDKSSSPVLKKVRLNIEKGGDRIEI